MVQGVADGKTSFGEGEAILGHLVLIRVGWLILRQTLWECRYCTNMSWLDLHITTPHWNDLFLLLGFTLIRALDPSLWHALRHEQLSNSFQLFALNHNFQVIRFSRQRGNYRKHQSA